MQNSSLGMQKMKNIPRQNLEESQMTRLFVFQPWAPFVPLISVFTLCGSSPSGRCPYYLLPISPHLLSEENHPELTFLPQC